MYYHIDLCRFRHIVQLQRKGDLPLGHGADPPAAGHIPHLDGGFLPAQYRRKRRIHLIAQGGKVGKGGLRVRQRSLVPGTAALLPLLCAPDPVCPLRHKGVCRLPCGAQGDAHRHGAVRSDPEIQVLHPAADHLIPDALRLPELRQLFCRHRVRKCGGPGDAPAAVPAPPPQRSARSPPAPAWRDPGSAAASRPAHQTRFPDT